MIPSDLFGLQHLFASYLWGGAIAQAPLFSNCALFQEALLFQQAVQQESLKRYKNFLQGYIRYKKTPLQTFRQEAPIIQQIGSITLRDYGALYNVSPHAKPVLVVPSLINQGYIFDLCPGYSIFEYMARHHLRPFLIDWGKAVTPTQGLGLEEYLHQAVFPFIKKVKEQTGFPKVSLMGYCMGGILALAATQTSLPIDRIALLATPWDFHQGSLLAHRQLVLEMIQQELHRANHLSAMCLQLFFYLLDPLTVLRKFSKFAHMPADTPLYQRFLALEQWVNDTSPLNRSLAEEIFFKWYGDNQLATTKKLFGQTLNQHIPTLLFSGDRDRIVPSNSTDALRSLLPQALHRQVPLGHVGLLISEQAKDLVWQPLVDWLQSK